MTPLQQRLMRLATHLLRIYVRTWRVRVSYPDGTSVPASDHPFGTEIYAVQERDLVSLSCMLQFASFQTLIAQGPDGDRATIVAEGLGSAAVRGSSRHDPTASAMMLVRALRGSTVPAFLFVDGPLGPPGIAKEGIASIARFTRRTIVPTVAHAATKIVLRRTWAQMQIPLPFSRVTIVLGGAIDVGERGNRESLERAAARVTDHFAGRATSRESRRESPAEAHAHR